MFSLAQQWSPERGIAQRRMQWTTNALIARGHSVAVLTAPPHYPDSGIYSQISLIMAPTLSLADQAAN